jgi:hypothetical protein
MLCVRMSTSICTVAAAPSCALLTAVRCTSAAGNVIVTHAVSVQSLLTLAEA